MRNRLAVVAVIAAAAFVPKVGHAELIYGLLNNNGAVQQLVTFDSTGRTVLSTVTLGIGTAGNSLSSIDVRPSTGQLYGFTGATHQVYQINTATGALTAVGPAQTELGSGGGVIAFNPTADRIRLIGTGGGNQNIGVSPTTGAVVSTDTSLAYAAGDSGFGLTPSINGTAFSNKVAGATTTTLYDLDLSRSVLTTQNPVSAGTLQTVGSIGFTLGSTGQGYGSFDGFDISGATGSAYLSDSAAGVPAFFGGPSATTATLYNVNLTTGQATSDGLIAGLPFGRSVEDIAVATAVPEPTTLGFAAVAGLAVLGRRRRIVA